jgi:hypothetical protein
VLGIDYKFRYNTTLLLLRDTAQMRVQTAPRLRSQPAPLSCQTPAAVYSAPCVNSSNFISKQQGAATWLLTLFVAAILVTVIVGLLFGYKLGYQRGYHLVQTDSQQSASSSVQATTELKALSLTNKVLSKQVAVTQQELSISLSNLDELRQNQQALNVENKQVAQLNEIYAQVLSEQGGIPLQVLGAKIEPLPENAFEYGFDVLMLSSEGRAKNLLATLTLLDEGSLVEVPLDPASFAIEGIIRIRGRFVMPVGFKPMQVKLTLEAGNQQIEQLYDWKLGAMVDDMPLSLLGLPELDTSPIAAKKPD